MTSKPPPKDAKEWPVDDQDLDDLCDAALEEPAYGAVERFVRGGSCPDEGFAETLRQSRERSQRLAAEVPHIRDILSARRKKAFLRALSVTGNISVACSAAGWSRGIPASLRKADADFRQKWDFAMENAGDVIEAEVFRRAIHGVQEEVWRLDKAGNPVLLNTVTRYSDQLAGTLLKGAKPEKYGDRKDPAGEGGNKGGVLVVPAPMSFDDWSAAAAVQQAKYREKQEVE